MKNPTISQHNKQATMTPDDHDICLKHLTHVTSSPGSLQCEFIGHSLPLSSKDYSARHVMLKMTLFKWHYTSLQLQLLLCNMTRCNMTHCNITQCNTT